MCMIHTALTIPLDNAACAINMITRKRGLYKKFRTTPLIPGGYSPIQHSPFLLNHLSDVAQVTLNKLAPQLVLKRLEPDRPEIMALRILDFLSSKKDFIRRKAHNFRNVQYYSEWLPVLAQQITKGQTLSFNGLCVSVNLPNPQLTGPSPFPHMGLYLACENVQKIAAGIKEIYSPGATFYLGFESNLYQRLYFLDDNVIQQSYKTAQDLNETAFYLNSRQSYQHNPVVIMDIKDMVSSSFGGLQEFEREVERIQDKLEPMTEWATWYRTIIPDTFFSSTTDKELFVTTMSKWRTAANELKYTGGKLGKGFMRFSHDVIPFTVSGRRTNMLALQMIPQNDPLPHQRVMSYLPDSERWLLQPYDRLLADEQEYTPYYVQGYDYPFFYAARGL